MKRIISIGILTVGIVISSLLSGCRKDVKVEVKEPEITEQSVVPQSTNASFSWKVDYPGEYEPSLQLSLKEDMSDAVSHGFSIRYYNESSLHLTVPDLNAATKYYYCYAVLNPALEYKSSVRYFTTLNDIPEVKTFEVSEIGQYAAKVSCEVTDDNGSEVTERGVCWSTNHFPTINDSHVSSGSGVGTFTVSLTELYPYQTFYVRAYATNFNGTAYGDELSFTTERGIPTLNTSEITDITWTTAIGGGEVISEGGYSVTERGVCWSTSHEPTVSSSHSNAELSSESFTVTMTGLTVGTKYYVRAYAKNSIGTSYGEEKWFETKSYEKPTVITSAVTALSRTSAVCGGNVTSEGGLPVTERGICWSTSTQPTINDNHIYSGTGGGTFSEEMSELTLGTTYYVRAFAKNEQGMSYGDAIQFTTIGLAPTGSIDGLFTIDSTGYKVFFSQGNLQYIQNSNSFQFAEEQWEIIGTSQNGTTTSRRDLFGWATSGWNCQNGYYCYYPYSIDGSYSIYYGPTGENDLTGAYARSDWGVYNAITNGGNQAGLWRTLTADEWVYVFNTRTTVSGIRFAKGTVSGRKGVILLPDDWSSSIYSLNSTNDKEATFDSNTISYEQWPTLENAGAVFLPITGYRNYKDVSYQDLFGYYWSSSCSGSYYAHNVYIRDSDFDPNASSVRYLGYAVRLVYPTQK